VPGPRVHHGPHSGRQLEFTGDRPSGRSGAWRLDAESQEARGWCRDLDGGLTSAEGAVTLASGGGEPSSAAELGVRGTPGEEVKRGERG
jgi:hypothetical protein